jgi:exodeoxyribonuclease V alpha subunit
MSPLTNPEWPVLNQLFEAGALPYEAYALAKLHLAEEKSEAMAAFICHLILAAQNGHLCIQIHEQTLIPPPEAIWLSESRENDLALLMHKLPALIIQGAQQSAAHLLDNSPAEDSAKPICRCGNLYYLKKYWSQENLWISCVKKLLQPIQGIAFDQSRIQASIEPLLSSKKLLPEQAQAILQASQQGLLLICGGPGTGKTYTAGQLIKTLWEHLSAEERQTFEIVLAAPTGKAAANLQSSLVKATEGIQNWQIPKAKTLHALLEINPYASYKKQTFSPLGADLILVDESSMIDTKMMLGLFAKIKPGARLILLGDHHQLPAVGMGSPFSDLKTYLQTEEIYKKQICELTTCLRAELQSILDLASSIKTGNVENMLTLLKNPSAGIACIFFESHLPLKKLQEKLLKHTSSQFSMQGSSKPEDLFALYNQFRILSPLRKGPFGIESLNQLFLAECLKNAPDDEPFAAPILLTKNDYKNELFNGEIGVLVKMHKQEGLHPGDYALFPAKNGEPIQTFRQIPALLLPQFEYAYCLSVHKSQGSEFEKVLLILPPGAEVFGREVFYTAVTRSKKNLQIWTNEQTLVQTMQRSSQRLSGFVQRMS